LLAFFFVVIDKCTSRLYTK